MPRLGDAAVSSQIHGAAARAGRDRQGLHNLYRGAPDIGVARVVDLGYVKEDRNTRAANVRLGNPSVMEWCAEVRLRICLFYESDNHVNIPLERCPTVVPFLEWLRVLHL